MISILVYLSAMFLPLANYNKSTFDVALLGVLSSDEYYEKSMFIEAARILKPSGRFMLQTRIAKSKSGNN